METKNQPIWAVAVLVFVVGCGGYSRISGMAPQAQQELGPEPRIEALEDPALLPGDQWAMALQEVRFPVARSLIHNPDTQPMRVELRPVLRSISQVATQVALGHYEQSPGDRERPWLSLDGRYVAWASVSQIHLLAQGEGEQPLYNDRVDPEGVTLELAPQKKIVLLWSVGVGPQTPRCVLGAGATRKFVWTEGGMTALTAEVQRRALAGGMTAEHLASLIHQDQLTDPRAVEARQISIEADLLVKVGGRPVATPALRREGSLPQRVEAGLPGFSCPGVF